MANDCEKYGIAITNYALDEKLNMSRQELFNHLLKCKKCREELFDWQNSIAVLRAEEYHNRPEVKKKTEELIRELKKEMIKSTPPPTDIKVEIDSAAEAIYKFVKDYTGGSSDKKVAIPMIRNETGLVDYPFYEAMGVLTINEKVTYTKDKDNRPSYVSPR